MNPSDALKQCQQSVAEYGLVDWSVGLDTAVTRFGVCDFRKKHISLSRKLCELNSAEEVTDTILHEIAHALAFERHGVNCGHDSRWKKICIEIGARPVACYDHSVVQPDAPWVLVHKKTGEVFRSYYKRPGRDWSKVWIRGRKKDTLGQLGIRSARSLTTGQSAAKHAAEERADRPPSTTVSRFTDQSVLEVHQALGALVKKYASEHGLNLSGTRCKYSPHKLDLTLTLQVPPSVDAQEQERIEFAAQAPIFDLTAEDYERSIFVDGRSFKLTGFKLNNRKYPIIGRDESGRQYKFAVDVLDQLVKTER